MERFSKILSSKNKPRTEKGGLSAYKKFWNQNPKEKQLQRTAGQIDEPSSFWHFLENKIWLRKTQGVKNNKQMVAK